LNRLYRDLPALHELDHEPAGFRWIDCNDARQSTLSWLRTARDGHYVVVVLNLTPVPRLGQRIGVPRTGRHAVLLNSDSRHYGGHDVGTAAAIATDEPAHGLPASLLLDLPPLGALLLEPAT
jgi:1,4-alpha-glucan branching enzyme